MNARVLPKMRMNVDEFLAWSARQPETDRYELVDGEIAAMSPERAWHNLVKLEVAVALRDAVKAANLSCTVFTDGLGVAIDDTTVREPDASVQVGGDVDLQSKLINAPIIVVEVVSPTSEHNDLAVKLLDYFKVDSVQHYLIVLAEQRAVLHHRRNDRGTIDTRIVQAGDVVLDPPGITVAVTALLGPAASATKEP
ncbi:MAG: Uma2 family endonuclease [Xanthobacteraceae bacterium]